MHGLVNRSIQCFLRDTYSETLWLSVAAEAEVEGGGFEAMLRYDDAVTDRVLLAAGNRLDRPAEALMEDLGAYLVSLEPLRRLLRFGGMDYTEFLNSLEELPGRARLAVPDIDMPDLSLRPMGSGRYILTCQAPVPGFGAVFAGVLRAMADDYGALALIDSGPTTGSAETVSIELLEAQFAAGRQFDLARPGHP
jgi:hypothetical protein